MTNVSLAAIIEDAAIHAAVCRYRKQGLACSTCTDLAERAERASAALRQIEGAAPHTLGPRFASPGQAA